MTVPIIAIYGATASGKSDLALALAKHINGEIISVDSAQIYRTMDIGTAKPDKYSQQDIKHHLIDIIEPYQSYSVAQFIDHCQQAVKDIERRQKPIILCGGTMLYFHRLFIGLSKLPHSDPSLRKQLYEQWQKSPLKTYQKLIELDPETAKKLHPNDSQRVLRALEIGLYHQPLSQLQKSTDTTPILKPIVNICLTISQRKTLHQRIQQRLDAMIDQGLVDEVKSLYDHPKLNSDFAAIRCVGYRQFWQYHDQQLTFAQAYEKTLFATRQLAKRQYTWMRRLNKLTNTHLIEYDTPNLLETLIQRIP